MRKTRVQKYGLNRRFFAVSSSDFFWPFSASEMMIWLCHHVGKRRSNRGRSRPWYDIWIYFRDYFSAFRFLFTRVIGIKLKKKIGIKLKKKKIERRAKEEANECISVKIVQTVIWPWWNPKICWWRSIAKRGMNTKSQNHVIDRLLSCYELRLATAVSYCLLFPLIYYHRSLTHYNTILIYYFIDASITSYYFWLTMMPNIIHPLPYHRLPVFLDG